MSNKTSLHQQIISRYIIIIVLEWKLNLPIITATLNNKYIQIKLLTNNNYNSNSNNNNAKENREKEQKEIDNKENSNKENNNKENSNKESNNKEKQFKGNKYKENNNNCMNLIKLDHFQEITERVIYKIINKDKEILMIINSKIKRTVKLINHKRIKTKLILKHLVLFQLENRHKV